MRHTIFETEINHDQTDSIESIIFGAGCFWGVERKFWSLPGVVMTSVGYAGWRSSQSNISASVLGGNWTC